MEEEALPSLAKAGPILGETSDRPSAGAVGASLGCTIVEEVFGWNCKLRIVQKRFRFLLDLRPTLI